MREECCTCTDRLNYVKLCEKYDQLESIHEVLVEDNLTYENQISDLEAKLAEKDKEIEKLKSENHALMSDNAYQEADIFELNSFKEYYKNNKISFAVEQLEKVKELLLSKAIQITGTSVDTVRLYSINEIFNNQIKQLKEGK